jgi:transcriptional regulator with GAF, ATPase, and Fis domain
LRAGDWAKGRPATYVNAIECADCRASMCAETPAESLRDAERRCISAALEKSRGKVYGPGGAAEALGLKPSTLQSRMKKLGISRKEADR